MNDKNLLTGMIGLRGLSAFFEVTAVILMIKLGRIESALRINAVMGLVGPTILTLVFLLGLISMAGKVNFSRLVMIAAGVGLIFAGIR